MNTIAGGTLIKFIFSVVVYLIILIGLFLFIAVVGIFPLIIGLILLPILLYISVVTNKKKQSQDITYTIIDDDETDEKENDQIKEIEEEKPN